MTSLNKQIIHEFKTNRALYVILIILIGFMGLVIHNGKQGADGIEYLRWTHSLVFDQDLHLYNNVQAVGGSFKLTTTGYVFERVNVGAALFWSPFLAASTLFLEPGATPGQEFYPITQQLWINFASWIYTILGGIVTYAALRRYYPARLVLWATIAILFGTSVLFYMVTFSFSSHPISIFLASLLLYLWLIDEKVKPVLHYFAMGLVFGWMILVASYNIAFSILIGISLIAALFKSGEIWLFIKHGVAAGLGAVLGFAPQMITWTVVFGSPTSSPYLGQLFWTQPYFFETLFSNFHGLFFYAPILLLVIPGLWWFGQTQPWRAVAIGLTWLVFTYIISTNTAWWGGSSLGNRYFLSLSPFFVLGITIFLQRSGRVGAILVGLGVLWMVGIYLQFLNGVRLTSDSIVFSIGEVLTGQGTAYLNMFIILPNFYRGTWQVVPIIVFLVMALLLIVIVRGGYGLISSEKLAQSNGLQIGIVSLAVIFILFIGWSASRGQQVKDALTAEGFYEQDHEVARFDTREIASDLVQRAAYHAQTNQPAEVVADLQLASDLWVTDTNPVPQRRYLGDTGYEQPPISHPLHLDFPGHVRLVGYEIHQADANQLVGVLIWEKLPGDKPRYAIEPIVRAFDADIELLGNTTIERPLPAEMLPAGSVFQDEFTLDLNGTDAGWVWLNVGIAEEPNQAPLDASGNPNPGMIAAVQLTNDPEPSFVTMSDVAACETVLQQQAMTGSVCEFLSDTVTRRYEPTAPSQALQVEVGEGIQLAGFDLSIIPQSDSILARVLLHWHAPQRVTKEYQVLIQLFDANNQPLVTHLDTPYQGERPTSTWLAGEWLVDEHVITVPPLASGLYKLGLNLIETETQTLLPSPDPLILQELPIP